MEGIGFVIGIVAAFALFLLQSPKKEAAVSQLDEAIKCPSCNGLLQVQAMLDAAVFWGPGAIVFDCHHCHDRVYFAPYDDFIETGRLGCSPVVDAIPYAKFAYPQGFDMASEIRGNTLVVRIKDRSWRVPRYG